MILPEQPWRSLPPGFSLALAGGEIHAWRASLDQAANRLEEMWRALSADERQRAACFHFDQHRERFVVGRGVLRSILGRYLDLDPGQVQFDYGPCGKPALARGFDDGNLSFNLAHSGSLGLYAFTRNRAIGVDVEQVRSMYDADDIAARSFSAAENAVYRELPEDQKPLAFYLCWTRKEAYVKALGDGLARPLEQFDVSLTPGRPACLLRVASDPDEVSRWSLISMTPLPGFAAAVAVQGHGLSLSCWHYQ